MLTKDEIRRLADETVRGEGSMMAMALVREGTWSGTNLGALLEVFANKIAAAESPDIVAVIDARLGAGWTGALAAALKGPDHA